MNAALRRLSTLAVVTAVLLSGGCGSLDLDDTLPDQRLIYKKQREAAENLEIPPDLAAGTFDDALDVPDPSGAPATFSEYSGGREQRRAVATQGDVLPEVARVELKRDQNVRWLVVDATPQQVWPRVVAFWRQQGILLVEQDPAVGVMKTDWLDNRAEIRRDIVTKTVSKVFANAYSTSSRDQYSLRIEPGPSRGTTEVHLTHHGMVEKVVTGTLGDTERTLWQPSGTDPEKEAEMLRRLMLHLGASDAGAAAATAGATGGAAAGAPRARLVEEGGQQLILIPEEFRRGWRLTGTALDRAGFAVEDRDQSRGLYYVRYSGDTPPRAAGQRRDPAGSDGDKPGMLSRMAFWKRDKAGDESVRRYQIQVEGGAAETRVRVLDDAGRPDASPAAQRMLSLIHQEMG